MEDTAGFYDAFALFSYVHGRLDRLLRAVNAHLEVVEPPQQLD